MGQQFNFGLKLRKSKLLEADNLCPIKSNSAEKLLNL